MGALDLAHTLEYAGIAIVLACLFLLCSFKPLAILQQSGYKNKKMLKWYSRKDNLLFQRYLLLSLMLLLSSGIVGVCFIFLGADWAARITLSIFVLFCVWFYFADKKYALKVPVHETERLKRLALVHFCLLAVFSYLFVASFNVIAYCTEYALVGAWRYVPFAFAPLLLPFIACVSNGLDGLYENSHNKKYVERARVKLAHTDAIKIGVTGSFGKTSVKNILAAMLEEKYAVLATPASYNTPMGVAKCVNEYAGKPYEIFIAEMGARNTGDIKELCDMVKPQYSVLTGICEQHLETFGSLENVIKTKGEIIFGTREGGTVVIGKSENTDKIVTDSSRDVVRVGEEAIQNLVCTCEGTSFTLCFAGVELPIHTALLGKHSAENIVLAAVTALKLGVEPEKIAAVCEKLDYVPHRLQVIKNGDVTVLDDGYNANVNGAAEAVEVLRSFPGRKIIVTPGLVELGILEEKANAAFGATLVGLDEIVLVGETLVNTVKDGYLEAGGKQETLTVVPTLAEAQRWLKNNVRAGDTVLFLNDLPDVY